MDAGWARGGALWAQVLESEHNGGLAYGNYLGLRASLGRRLAEGGAGSSQPMAQAHADVAKSLHADTQPVQGRVAQLQLLAGNIVVRPTVQPSSIDLPHQ